MQFVRWMEEAVVQEAFGKESDGELCDVWGEGEACALLRNQRQCPFDMKF